MSFSDFLKQAKVTDNPTGDLIGDLKLDRTRPDDFASPARLRGHMHLRSACPEALRMVPAVWKRYQRWVARQAN